MSAAELGVAVVGAGPDHWSGTAHIPALQAQDGVRLQALVTSSPDSAARAAQRWGVPATSELRRVLEDDEVDAVTVTVRVPHHAEIVGSALAAGKHVYCEWPLARDTAEARTLAALAGDRPDRVHLAGLQGRFSPELRTAAGMIAEGRIGRPLTANVRVYLSHGIQRRPAHRAHLRHATVGATVLTILGGHVLDMVQRVLGSATASTARIWPAVPEFVLDTGERLPRDAPDNVVALLDTGHGDDRVPTAVHLSQTAAAQGFAMDVHGTEGTLHLSAAGQPQFGGLGLAVTPLGASVPSTVEPRRGLPYASALPAGHPGQNVASAYAAMAHAVRSGERDPLLPGFDQAVALHELLDAVTEVGAERTAVG